MFFSVTQQPDHRFDHSLSHLGLWINTDAGWTVNTDSVTKGYSSNHCRLVLSDQGVTIEHSEPRSFPLWFEHGFVTNLFPDRGQSAWVSDHLHVNPDGHIVWTPNNIDCRVPAQPLTLTQAQKTICAMLDRAVAELGDQPVKLFCSGGLDTYLLYALLTHHGSNFELIADNHWELNSFVVGNQTALSRYWSYNPGQLHHWTVPTWLATGGCGDEYFLRGPAVIAMLTAWHDIDFASVLAQHTDQYHYHHFVKYNNLWHETWQQRHDLRRQYPSREQLNSYVMNVLANDHQHWHLGETTTWTPFKNIEIARNLLQCDIQDLMPQFLHGEFTRQIISAYCPQILQFVSTYKNHNNHERIQQFLQWHQRLVHTNIRV